ncbi:MAG: C13 family peptidase [Gemmatimonadales bacterium]
MSLESSVLSLESCVLSPPTQPAPETHVLIITGLAGEPQYRTAFAKLGRTLRDAAIERWGVADSLVRYLAEDPAADKTRITGRSTKVEILATVAAVAARAQPNDVVLLFLAGHGSQQGDQPQFNLPGPDLTAGDLAMALGALDQQLVVVVNTASASGGFVPALTGRGRIVITATKSGFERNATTFGDWFVKALTSDEADADKNGRISVAEAYGYARREVVRSYQTGKKLLTEHAQLDDDGDGKGTHELAATGDGGVAKTVSFTLTKAPTITDPKLAPLVAERRQLEAAVAGLRARKATMDSTGYERELERLLVRLAEVNEALRGGGVRP